MSDKGCRTNAAFMWYVVVCGDFNVRPIQAGSITDLSDVLMAHHLAAHTGFGPCQRASSVSFDKVKTRD